MAHSTRESWLHKAISIFETGLFKQHRLKIPKVRVSIGFPSTGRKSKRIGEHWHPKASSDGVSTIFISPALHKPVEVLETLAHELIHAILPDAKHGPKFRKAALSIGFLPPMRSTPSSKELLAHLETVASELGPFPHAKLNFDIGRKKQTTRMVKMECQDCGYKVRASRLAILSQGPVVCPCNDQPMYVDIDLIGMARE